MIYTSTVTSKGTITLPARIRKQLGITPGKIVDIKLEDDKVLVKPQSGWDEFFEAIEPFGREVRKKIARGEAKPLRNNNAIAKAAQLGRQKGY